VVVAVVAPAVTARVATAVARMVARRRRVVPLVASTQSSPVVVWAVAVVPPRRLRRMPVGSVAYGYCSTGSD
jgi:hypothetical protein